MYTRIIPTVGRVLWYHPDPHSSDPAFAPAPICAAIVAHVHSDHNVNLAVFDGIGNSHSRRDVPLCQDGDPKPSNGGWCEWMPYQKGQAARQEAIAARETTSTPG